MSTWQMFEPMRTLPLDRTLTLSWWHRPHFYTPVHFPALPTMQAYTCKPLAGDICPKVAVPLASKCRRQMDDERKMVEPTYYHLGDVSTLKVIVPGGASEFIVYDLEEVVVQR